MFQFTDYIHPLYFFISLAITLFLVMILAPKKRIVVQHVDLKNHADLVFRREGPGSQSGSESGSDSCYKYIKKETECMK